MTVEGHANFAPKGQDIVCAGISTLIQTLFVCGADEDSTVEDGKVYVKGSGSEAYTAFKVVLKGLELIRYTYPQYVGIVEDEGCTFF